MDEEDQPTIRKAPRREKTGVDLFQPREVGLEQLWGLTMARVASSGERDIPQALAWAATFLATLPPGYEEDLFEIPIPEESDADHEVVVTLDTIDMDPVTVRKVRRPRRR